jgi:gas vesicle protein
MECKYCGNTFSTKSSLNSHIRLAKYCLKGRNKKVEIIKCDSCLRTFASRPNLNRHVKICRIGNIIAAKITTIELLEEELISLKGYREKYNYLNDDIIQLKIDHKNEIRQLHDENKKEIKDLQNKIENIAIQASRGPTSVNTYNNRNEINTVIQNLEVTTDEYINSQVDNLTIEHIKKGPSGYVEYALGFPFKYRIVCVDYARRKVKYKNASGDVMTDAAMSVLVPKLFKSIEVKNAELANDYGNHLPDEMDSVEKLRIMADMGKRISTVRECARGESTNAVHDFVKGVCSRTTN